jgi:hypothetical protein
VKPSAEEVNLWSRRGFGHDALNQWICVKAKAKRLGFYGKCRYCDGDGEIYQSSEIQRLHDGWQEVEPPQGEGYQLWENCSEGSPISPVFASLEALCEWAETHATTFGSFKTTKEKWMAMLKDDFVHHDEGNMIFM